MSPSLKFHTRVRNLLALLPWRLSLNVLCVCVCVCLSLRNTYFQLQKRVVLTIMLEGFISVLCFRGSQVLPSSCPLSYLLLRATFLFGPTFCFLQQTHLNNNSQHQLQYTCTFSTLKALLIIANCIKLIKLIHYITTFSQKCKRFFPPNAAQLYY